ncbi:Bifunctional inhibitor/plant lipid transfer protein/seed storage helical domain [Dillenia turbinata]|uniref:Bifunctional inhibitor/plant lipid transfer protein/seed storage helical domain n=1 Tax=Dillenia turbinata TaxID=194707 RepID=A0AAN8ZEB6_9MAGN
MEGFMAFMNPFLVVATLSAISVIPATKAQIGTPCASSITSFTPCFNYVTGSSPNGSSPIAGCCDSFKTMMDTSADCACLVITGSVPFSFPFNRTLSISFLRACQLTLPVRCKASGAPLPTPGPVPILLAPTPAPSPFSFQASEESVSQAPEPEAPSPEPGLTSDIAPASPPADTTDIPTTTKPVLTPSASNPSCVFNPSLLLLSIIMFFKYY